MSVVRPGDSVLFVGLGTMGLPMAASLHRAGFAVTGFDRNAAAADRLAALGAKRADDLRAAARAAAVVVTMLPDDAVVGQVFGADGLMAALQPGALVIEMSTTGPATKVALARDAEARGVRFIECPVGKTVEHAVAGTLALMAGGDPALVADARPVLDAMGNDLHLCGPVGAGSAMKLVNNALVACVNAASLEALVAGRKAGLALDTMLGVFKTTLAWNNALAVGLPRKALKRDFQPGFMTKLAHKDVGLALAMAGELAVPMRAGEAAFAILERALAAGYGADDNAGSMMRVCEADGGIRLGEPPAAAA